MFESSFFQSIIFSLLIMVAGYIGHITCRRTALLMRPPPPPCDDICEAKIICAEYNQVYQNDQAAFNTAVKNSGNPNVTKCCKWQTGYEPNCQA